MEGGDNIDGSELATRYIVELQDIASGRQRHNLAVDLNFFLRWSMMPDCRGPMGNSDTFSLMSIQTGARQRSETLLRRLEAGTLGRRWCGCCTSHMAFYSVERLRAHDI